MTAAFEIARLSRRTYLPSSAALIDTSPDAEALQYVLPVL
jgi:hypothetical protein